MPQEAANVMTPYEIIATVIAILALLQPWIIKLWDRFGRKIRVNFIPSAKIKLYYNRSGAYVYLGGVIETKNKAAIVKDIPLIYSTHRKILSLMTVNKQLNYSDSK